MREQQAIVGGFSYGAVYEDKGEYRFGPRLIEQGVREWRAGRRLQNPQTIHQQTYWQNLEAPVVHSLPEHIADQC